AVLRRHCRAGVYRPRPGRELLKRLTATLQICPPDPEYIVGNLSGGNQQKVLLAKWLATTPEVLVLDEPTRGVDVGAKALIHEAIARVADSGKCVLLISSDLPELVALSDRVLVMRKGRVVGQMHREQATEAAMLLAANGEGEAIPA
ncbi:MAG: ATP-binding cassette domain-containing protein, partial [Planctomycetota bacterium]